ncbi:MAG: hypothetical protein A2144_14165 [Chloroflexi bacterium RBG_16_50_9]|nr:MAG: hypothetical protein A2144_14165 [Chloroflexi bacterium RBG_16_50_9]
MDIEIKNSFIELWRKYFKSAELPFTYYYSEIEGQTELVRPGSVPACVIGALAEVRKGRSLSFNADSIGCFGGRRYLGFTKKLRPGFEYFLSCGIPGKMEGERYKKSPELVKETMKNWPDPKAPAPIITFKRWDNLEKEDKPEIVIFFAQPDVLSGLFTLANFDEPTAEAVFTPMGSGCSSIVSCPYLEKDSQHPRAVIGMFDPSARPYVPKDVLSFSVPMSKFVRMMENMEESFLTTDTWKKLHKRID